MSQGAEPVGDAAGDWVEDDIRVLAGVLHGTAISLLVYGLAFACWWFW